ncbi:oxidation resistance protein 1 [Savitreella phatthalungensis]
MSSVVSDSTLGSSPVSQRSRRRSSAAEGVYSPKELAEEGIKIVLPQGKTLKKLKWQINRAPGKIDFDKLDVDEETLKMPLTEPPVNRIDLRFPQSLTLTCRKPRGYVSVRDAMDTIYKKFKSKADEDLGEKTLTEMEWDPNDYGTLELILQK